MYWLVVVLGKNRIRNVGLRPNDPRKNFSRSKKVLITARRDSEEKKIGNKKKMEKREEHESETTRPSHCGGKTATEQTFNEQPRLKSGVLEFEETTTMKNPRALDNGHPRRVHCRGFGRFANFLSTFFPQYYFFFFFVLFHFFGNVSANRETWLKIRTKRFMVFFRV